MKSLAALVLLALGLTARPARAETADLGEAKASFNAGAIAYAAGDYLAAIQALEAAYRVAQLPAIVFSLAQAERRQYFASRDAQYLGAAIAHFRRYLAEVPTGGRRADATDALAQLEPLLATGAAAAGAAPAAVEAAKTRLMVSSSAEAAVVSLDAAAAVPAPLIVEVAPGRHRVRVDAAGFYAAERDVIAVSGALVPIEVPLREQPAVLLLRGPRNAECYLDGRLLGRLGKDPRVPLSSGSHTLGFAQNGYEPKTISLRLTRGEERSLDVVLVPTAQRTTSIVFLITSGVSLAAGVGFSVAAVAEENKATDILAERDSSNITSNDLDQYDEAVRRRNQFRTGAAVSFGIAVGTLVSGLLLYALDRPTLHEEEVVPGRSSRRARVRLAGTPPGAGSGLAAELSF